jgi:hypothetical protein
MAARSVKRVDDRQHQQNFLGQLVIITTELKAKDGNIILPLRKPMWQDIVIRNSGSGG